MGGTKRRAAGTTTLARHWRRLERDVIDCERCSRLITHCREVARVRRRAYRDQEYWGRPVPGFGDTRARIMFLGLAPAAHGANRTGRMFTGDGSGDWLYGALHRAGLASQAEARDREDGLRLSGAYVSAVCHCAPPANRPVRDEMEQCAGYLDREIELLKALRVVVALGRIAWEAALRRVIRVAPGSLSRPRPSFAHAARVELPLGPQASTIWLVASYHPSRQNTQTGRLTRPMLDGVIHDAVGLAKSTS